ncbi:MAG: hypothetical protein ACK40G_13885 [Cytophagaceae bacterium]
MIKLITAQESQEKAKAHYTDNKYLIEWMPKIEEAAANGLFHIDVPETWHWHNIKESNPELMVAFDILFGLGYELDSKEDFKSTESGRHRFSRVLKISWHLKPPLK